jgi:uncharacterized cupredoxin-like copper-binding protein
MTPRSTCMKIGFIPLATLGALALASGGPAGASSKATTVKAVETSFHIALSKKTFKPGIYTFVAENKSTITHALAITGPGLHNAATADIAPGKSLNLTVTFTDGKYDIFCPVPGHKAMGMNVNIVVTGGAAHATSTTKTKSPASTATSSGGVSY